MEKREVMWRSYGMSGAERPRVVVSGFLKIRLSSFEIAILSLIPMHTLYFAWI